MSAAQLIEPDTSAHLTKYPVTVLLVDDQAMVAEAVRRMLEGEENIEFHYCQDPTQAIRAAQEISPTVILQDLVMPQLDGLTLVKFFRANEKTRNIPLIVLSTREEATTKAEAFALGANDYLVKLPDRIELIARIRYHSKGYINLLQRNEALRLLEAELAEAAEYVIKILPKPITEGAITTDWRFVPSTDLGGDAFGYHWVDDDHFALYLLDVTGHGVGAALLSVSIMNVLRTQTLPDTDFCRPHQVLETLNETFPEEENNGNLFSLWYGIYRPSSGELAFSSGGHPPALLISGPQGSAGRLDQLRTKGPMLGSLPDMVFQQNSIRIEPPARLYVYSDGVYEIRLIDGRRWPMDDFYSFMVHPEEAGVSKMDHLLDHVRQISGEKILDDDFSIFQVDFY